MLSFWSWSNPSEFHKTSAGRICLVEEDQCRNTNIFGRHAINDPNVERNFASKGDIDFSVTKFKFCDKCEKVATNTMKEIEFLGLVINSVNMALALPQEKKQQMHATYSVTKGHNYGIKQTPRKTLVHCSGSASMENFVQVLVTTKNSGNERNKFLSNRNKIKPTFTGRVGVVEGEFASSEQQTTENRNATINHPSECF